MNQRSRIENTLENERRDLARVREITNGFDRRINVLQKILECAPTPDEVEQQPSLYRIWYENERSK